MLVTIDNIYDSESDNSSAISKAETLSLGKTVEHNEIKQEVQGPWRSA